MFSTDKLPAPFAVALLAVIAARCADGAEVRVSDPYAGPEGSWYRGQLHAHSTEHRYFVAADSLRDKVERYRDAGFDFVCITDHNFELHPLRKEPYAVLPGRDPGVPGIHFISGAEIGFTIRPAEDVPPTRKHHIGGVGMDWSAGRGDSLFHVAETDLFEAQDVVDSIRTMRYAAGKPALAILNHPEMAATYDVGIYPSDLAALRDQAGIEVFNTLWAVSPRGRESPAEWAVSRRRGRAWQRHGASHWDFLLTRGSGMRWGFATDDAHAYEVGRDFLGGWILVHAESLATEPLLDAVVAGRFVACVDSCEGAVHDNASAAFTTLAVRGREIVAASDRPTEFTWWTDYGNLSRRTAGVTSDTYRVEGWESYVRLRIRNDAGAAYSQPFFVEAPDRDPDRWQLRAERTTRALYHFEEGSGPLAAAAPGYGDPILLEWRPAPPVEEWTTLEDVRAYQDSLWGGWLHNTVGTTPDETDVDRDRWGYALRAWGATLRGEIPVRPGSAFLGEGGFTLEWIGAVERRIDVPQPLIVNEEGPGTGAGWRVEVAEDGAPEEYRFACAARDGSSPVVVSVPGTVPGEVHLVSVVVDVARDGARIRTYVDGAPTADRSVPALRLRAGGESPVAVFADGSGRDFACHYRLRELRLSEGARSGRDIRDDARRLGLAAAGGR